MKLFALLAFALSMNAFANTIECSNASGSLRFEQWQYSGGAAPPEDMETFRANWFLNGMKFGTSEGRFFGAVQEISKMEDDCSVEVTYVTQATIEPQDMPSVTDFVICNRFTLKCLPPSPRRL